MINKIKISYQTEKYLSGLKRNKKGGVKVRKIKMR